ncbi:MAG TPA: trypsin-like peptidase domain-containing protein [Terriglobales bacterium]
MQLPWKTITLFFTSLVLISMLQAQTRPVTPAENLGQFDQALENVAQRVLPAVVQISVSGFGPSREPQDSQSVISRQRGIGSGVIVDPSGYIITNSHVVAGAQRIQVVMRSVTTELVPFKTSLQHRQRTFEAKLLGIHRFTDLALLKIEATDLPFIPLKEEFRARLGQTALAIGSPEGLDHTITRGIVSALGRQIDPDHPMVYIQTDAPINPGNSGGALVDRDGNLLGINTFIYSQSGGSEGLGFAVPEPTVRYVYQELKQNGHVRQTVIGASAQTITTTLARGLKLSQDWGVVISDVVPEGPADKAGLRTKDVVVAMDNRMIDSLPRFAASLFLHPHGEPVEMDILRGSEPLKLRIAAVEAGDGVENLADLIDPQRDLIGPMGIFVLELNKVRSAAASGQRSSFGAIVAGKADYRPTLETDLAIGDVIRSINGVHLSGGNDLRSQLEHFKPGDAIVLEIERQGRYQFVAFDME